MANTTRSLTSLADIIAQSPTAPTTEDEEARVWIGQLGGSLILVISEMTVKDEEDFIYRCEFNLKHPVPQWVQKILVLCQMQTQKRSVGKYDDFWVATLPKTVLP